MSAMGKLFLECQEHEEMMKEMAIIEAEEYVKGREGRRLEIITIAAQLAGRCRRDSELIARTVAEWALRHGSSIDPDEVAMHVWGTSVEGDYPGWDDELEGRQL